MSQPNIWADDWQPTDAQVKAYTDGNYWFSPPPVGTDRWCRDDWIRFLINSGGFNPPVEGSD